MQSFLEEVADQCLQLKVDPENIIFVLPSKRAGLFLRAILAKKYRQTVFAPKIYSIEGFIKEVSGLDYASQTQLHFELYEAYLLTKPNVPDTFYDFCKWGQTLLQDFNEIDRYLIDTGHLFSYLADVRKLEQWTGNADKTPLMEGYIRFWNSLEPIYHSFRQKLLKNNQGFQGMVYRIACNRLPDYMDKTAEKTHIFAGFNALNKAESNIIQHMLEMGKAQIFWDIDRQFLEDPIHDAGYFIRRYLSGWKSLSGMPPRGISEQMQTQKKIQITALPKKVAQVKYTGLLLKQLFRKTPETLDKTAVVLGDELLLNPLLHAIPQEISSVNVTMGYPLHHTPLEGLFSRFFDLYLHWGPQGWFYRNVLALLAHPYLEPLFVTEDTNFAQILRAAIAERNWIHINLKKIQSLPGTAPEVMKLVFFEPPVSPEAFINRSLRLIHALKEEFQEHSRPVVLEELYRFFNLFNQLGEYVAQYPYVKDLKTLQGLYRSLLSAETIDFRGEPMEGLQIMGMLESRNLDFETVILTSVNEGILPAGKTDNSFIPFDLKREFGLPTYKEKDAIYSYHFYRLLQRAKTIFLLYNSEPDVLEGGEKSRLISQLLMNPYQTWDIQKVVATPGVHANVQEPMRIYKDDEIIRKLKEKALSGFSPTSLTDYIRNPIEFYKKTVLGIDETLEVDESITASIFGTVVHATVEDLYKPFIGQRLTPDMLRSLYPKIKGVVKTHFARFYADTDLGKGKNRIAYEVLVRYMERLINTEAQDAQHNRIEILALEKKFQVSVPIDGLDQPFILRGIIDRIDRCNGRIRIIDYKTGQVIPSNVEITSWQALIADEAYSKAFQLLCYATMYQKEVQNGPLEAGIISLKNLKAGLLSFAIKEAGKRKGKQQEITHEVLTRFQLKLQELVLQIFDPNQPFIEKRS